jgi:PKHD-type hydroxylase
MGNNLSMKAWWQLWESGLKPDECAAVVECALSEFEAQVATVGHGSRPLVSGDIRKGTVRWIPRSDERFRWLWDRLVLLCLQANHAAFGLELSDFPQLRFAKAQFTEYHADGEHHYNWHEDNAWLGAGEVDRKLSCVVQLSDPSSYEGGRLRLERDDLEPGKFVQQGAVIFFPSHLRHKVEPVTAGVRYSLVVWFEGPRMR